MHIFFLPNIPVLSSLLCTENMFFPGCASEWPSWGAGDMLQSYGCTKKNPTQNKKK